MHTIKKFYALILTLIVALPLISQAQERVSPVDVFEQTWRIFDTNYPYFTCRGIDWNAVHLAYRPKIRANSTDDQLFQVLSSMLSLLDDGHVNLSSGETTFNAGITNHLKMDDFSEELVRTKYLNGKFKARQDSNLVYGWLPDSIGYLRIRGWKHKFQVGAIVDTILAELKTAKGIVVDVRANTGGNAFAAEAIADRFADRERFFGKISPKRGPGHDSLFPPRYKYIKPIGPVQFTRSVVVLQHRFSESATEEFITAMRVLPHVTTMGDLTSGCFGIYYPDELANGWTISMPWCYDVDQNDRCWVGIGLPPDLHITNSKEDIDSRRDRVLEFAIDLINRGGRFSREVSGSLAEIRESLYDRFVQTAESEGVSAAVAEFHRIQTEEPDSFYFSPQECMNGAQVLPESGKIDELAAIMELAHKTWPDAISFPWVLGMVYKQQGRLEDAAAAYRMIAESEAYFPWDESFVEQAKQFLANGE